jgi:hypothetical protein
MGSLENIERLFKMRQEFKECREPQESRVAPQPCSTKEEAKRISELINKIKN